MGHASSSNTRPARRLTQRAVLPLIAGQLYLCLGGCAGGAVGSDLVVTPKPRPIAAPRAAALRLPQDEAFSITFAPSQRQPGLGGAATAEASATKDGSASATCGVEGAGSASASFQVGHAFVNDGSHQVDLGFLVQLEHGSEMACKPAALAPIANASLWLYVRDGRGRVLSKHNLSQHDAEAGAASSTEKSSVAFTQTLGPGDSISVFVAGTTSVEFEGGFSARAAVTLKNLTMEATTHTAPAAPTHVSP